MHLHNLAIASSSLLSYSGCARTCGDMGTTEIYTSWFIAGEYPFICLQKTLCFLVMMSEAFGFSKGAPCVAENYLATFGRVCFGRLACFV